MPDMKNIADEADMIVCGYAYKNKVQLHFIPLVKSYQESTLNHAEFKPNYTPVRYNSNQVPSIALL